MTEPMNICRCGCGGIIPLLRCDGQPQIYVQGHNWKNKKRVFSQDHKDKIKKARKNQIFTEETRLKLKQALAGKHSGKENPGWKGGFKKSSGYVLVLDWAHPSHNSHGYISQHHLVMEKMIGRYLTKNEVVHHINHIRNDNRPENLMLFSSHSEHMKHHKFGQNK